VNDMDDVAPKSFSPHAMLGNIANIKGIIQRVRQKDGGIGADGDELCLHRAIHDIDLLVDIVEALKTAHGQVQNKLVTLQQTYEGMLHERNERIKELERQLGIRPTPPEQAQDV